MKIQFHDFGRKFQGIVCGKREELRLNPALQQAWCVTWSNCLDLCVLPSDDLQVASEFCASSQGPWASED